MSSTSDRPTGRPRTIDPAAVSLVALRLFDEQGFDAVSMDDVAAAAGISRGRCSGCSRARPALVWGGLDEFATRFTDALRLRPASESAWGRAPCGAYRIGATFPGRRRRGHAAPTRVIRANPSLERGRRGRVDRPHRGIERFVAERDGSAVDGLTTTVRAHALAAAASAALTWWALHGTAGRRTWWTRRSVCSTEPGAGMVRA